LSSDLKRQFLYIFFMSPNENWKFRLIHQFSIDANWRRENHKKWRFVLWIVMGFKNKKFSHFFYKIKLVMIRFELRGIRLGIKTQWIYSGSLQTRQLHPKRNFVSVPVEDLIHYNVNQLQALIYIFIYLTIPYISLQLRTLKSYNNDKIQVFDAVQSLLSQREWYRF